MKETSDRKKYNSKSDFENIDYRKISKDIRRLILSSIYNAGSGHLGASLSIVEIVVALYFTKITTLDQINNKERDRFVLSKGHGVPALYSVFAKKNLLDQSLMSDLRKLNSPLQGHPDRSKLSLIDASTGSLGQGLSIASGIAYGMKYAGWSSRTYTVLGDGELDSGQNWEAIAFAKHYKLDNLIVIVDLNGWQNDGKTEDILDLCNISDKFQSFGWRVEVTDGHDVLKIKNSILNIISSKEKPSVIIAKTIKGKGISFMESNPYWNCKKLEKNDYELALKELV